MPTFPTSLAAQQKCIDEDDFKHNFQPDDPYEAPERAEITLNSAEMSLEQEVDILLAALKDRGIITG